MNHLVLNIFHCFLEILRLLTAKPNKYGEIF
jgi:hypothetical protein